MICWYHSINQVTTSQIDGMNGKQMQVESCFFVTDKSLPWCNDSIGDWVTESEVRASLHIILSYSE